MSRLFFTLTITLGLALVACQKNADETDQAGPAENARSDRVEIAKVDGTTLYKADVERMAAERGLIKADESLPQSDPSFQTLLEELIDQRLLAEAAIRRGLDKTPENKRRLAAARERILSNVLVEEHLKKTVNERTIHRMYDQQSELVDRGDEIRARHILLSDEASAQAVVTALSEGQGFAELARSVSTDEGTREKGGDLGWFSRDMLSRDFTRVVFSTPVGERTEPFETSQGWHIAEVQNRRAPPQQSLEELRPNIVKFMTFDAIQSLLEDLRNESEIETFYALTPEGEVNLPEEVEGAGSENDAEEAQEETTEDQDG